MELQRFAEELRRAGREAKKKRAEPKCLEREQDEAPSGSPDEPEGA